MSESEPIVDFRRVLAGRAAQNDAARLQANPAGGQPASPGSHRETAPTTFNRLEIREILRVYGRYVASGEWRDYAIDMGRETAVFSIFRRSSECPIYRITKSPKLARRQGMYSVIAASGVILKRGPDLRRVLAVLDKSPRLVSG